MQGPETASAAITVREIIFLGCILSASAAGLCHAAISEAVQNDAFKCEPQTNEVVRVRGMVFWTYIQVAQNPSAVMPPPWESVALFPGYECSGPLQVGAELHREDNTGKVPLHPM